MSSAELLGVAGDPVDVAVAGHEDLPVFQVLHMMHSAEKKYSRVMAY
jgi:hypothetical protein